MTEKITSEEYQCLTGKTNTGKRGGKDKQDNDLSMLTLIAELEGIGLKFGGKWAKGMAAEPSTVYLEYPFSAKRKYRADLSIPTERLILEIHGGSWVMRRSKNGQVQYLGGAHHSPSGRRRDMEKANLANIEGWTYLEVEWKDVKDGSAFELIKSALGRDDASNI